jgi:tRNA G18 (ribose-2'-O)-methylase SpoU
VIPAAIRISDPGDPRIEAYRALRERDLVGRAGLYVAEGQVVLEKLIARGRHPLRSLLVAEHRLPAVETLLAGLPPTVPVYAAGQAVMDAIAGFPIHRGILAVGERSEPTPEALLAELPQTALVVGLSAVANHDNMGGVFRNAAAFGADAVLLDAACCDPLYRKAIRVSVGLAETLRTAGFEPLALSPAGEVDLDEVEPAPRTAVLFGAEGPGLSTEVLARVRTVRIPMAGDFDSLNLATSSGIVLHRIASRRR